MKQIFSGSHRQNYASSHSKQLRRQLWKRAKLYNVYLIFIISYHVAFICTCLNGSGLWMGVSNFG